MKTFNIALAAITMLIGSLISSVGFAAIHTIDLLVVHPPKSVLNTDILTRVASMETYANKALDNSQANIRFRVVKIVEIDLPNPKTDPTTLSNLRKDQNVQELRAKYGADLVTMITPTGPYCGVGYVIRGSRDTIYPGYQAYGYNIVGDRCISSFAHELGHNLGLGHSYKQSSYGGLYSWGRGHGVDNNFVTTMAYSSAYNGRRLQFFSNPDVINCNNLKCGSEIHHADGAHAVKAAGVSGPQIAAWFEEKETPVHVNHPPVAHKDFSVTREAEAIIIDVLANDVDPDKDPLNLNFVGEAKHGITAIFDGKIQYKPEPGFIGQDNFEYIIDDGNEQRAKTWVTVNVGWGTNYEYYQGSWNYLPDFSSINPIKKGISHNFSLESRQRDHDFAFRYFAQLEVPVSGVYQFFLSSDDGSRLTLNKTVIIDNDVQQDTTSKTGTGYLIKGSYRLELAYFQASGAQKLQLEWQGPGMERQLVQSSSLRLAEPKNSFPVAKDDRISIAQGSEAEITVLANDTDSDLDPLSIISFTQGENGSVTQQSQSLIYQAEPGFSGTDHFSYQINDGRGGEDTGLVTVHVGQGVKYEYYEGNWSSLPNFDSLTPVSTGVQENLSLKNRIKNDYFGFRFKANLEVPQDGRYIFFILSDDGSKFLIDGKEVINNDGVHGTRWRGKWLSLTAGVHNIEIQYFEKTGRERLNLYWYGPGVRFQRLSKNHLRLVE